MGGNGGAIDANKSDGSDGVTVHIECSKKSKFSVQVRPNSTVIEVTSERKKIKFTMEEEEEEEEAPPVVVKGEEEEEERSVVYMVGQLDDSSMYSAAIFKVEIGRNGEVIGDNTKVKDRVVDAFDRKKYFDFEPCDGPCVTKVACDMVGHNLYLVCNYSRLAYHQNNTTSSRAPLHIFNTLTQQLTELREGNSSTLAPKPFPFAMAAHGKLYVYGESMSTSLKIPRPTLECFNCETLLWESSSSTSTPPQFQLPRASVMEGYAVINNFLLISVVDTNGGISPIEFFYCKISGSKSSNNKWKKCVLSEETTRHYYPLSGKAEFVDGVIYTRSNGRLVAYRVDSEALSLSLSLSPPIVLGFPEFATPPVEWYDSVSMCFAYMGIGKRFCMIRSGEQDESSFFPDQQYVAISVVEVSDDLTRLTTLTSTVCTLNIRGLNSQPYFDSCFVV